jgi:hypothetical protein
MVPYAFEPSPDQEDGGSPVAVEDSVAEAAAATPRSAALAPDPLATVRTSGAQAQRGGEARLNRDYSYVPGEIMRIVIVAGFLIASLVITSIFR